MSQQFILTRELPGAASGISHLLSWKGFAWASLLPGVGIFLFYALVLHSRLVLGRWPHFGEAIPTRLFSLHDACFSGFAAVLYFSLYAVPFIVIGCLSFRRTRPIAVYVFAYAAFVALAGVSLQLAPHEFLNWFFD